MSILFETAYLGLGGNIGDTRPVLQEAVGTLKSNREIVVRKVSSLYKTKPIGYTDQSDFLNAVVQITTTLPPEELLLFCLSVEKTLGRKRTVKWGPRVIDIDILLYGKNTICTSDLTIPHPYMFERAFVIVPLAELTPAVECNGDTVSILELAEQLAKQTRIERISW